MSDDRVAGADVAAAACPAVSVNKPVRTTTADLYIGYANFVVTDWSE
ncbi:hypothetical protein AB0F91_43985 [Amycolatopsis sp. NPDC023774]